MDTTQNLLDQAAGHLNAAAALAETLSGGDASSPWNALAGLIRLTGSGLDHLGTPSPALTPVLETVQQHLSEAVTALDQIPPLDGPADLQLWAWHITELARHTPETAAS
jgi:hypothetical protein